MTMDTLSNLCLVYGEAGRNADALSHCERALRVAEGMRYVEPSRKAYILASVGIFQFLVHGPAEAEPFFKRAQAIAENGLGPEHPVLGQILFYYSNLLELMNRKAEAKEFRRRAKVILDAASSADSRKYTIDLSELIKRQSRR
jgi:tetratricopeptide (TPR) repeat protein